MTEKQIKECLDYILTNIQCMEFIVLPESEKGLICETLTDALDLINRQQAEISVKRKLLEKAEGQINNDVPSLEMIAEHLIANGVVLPPCRVEQMVWLIKPLNWQQTEWGIKEGKISMIQQKADKSWKFRVTENHSVQDYTVDKIGKTVFLTEDQAEQKLKELSDNGNL